MISDNNLPHGWVTTFLGEIAEWGSGGTPSRRVKEYFEGDIPWIKTGELNQKYISDSEEKISRQAVEKSSAKIFPRGSVGIAMYGATIGKLAIWKIDASTNQACAVAKIDINLLFNEFLYYFLLSEKSSLIKAGKGGAQPNISQGIIKYWEINLPPLSEQHRIVAKIEELFSEIDKGVESLKTAKAQLQVYRQALLKHAFEGKLTAQWRSNNPDKVVPAAELLRSIEQAREERYQQQLTDWQTAIEKWEFNGAEDRKPGKPKLLPFFSIPSTEDFRDITSASDGLCLSALGNLIDEPKYGTSKKCSYESQGIGVLRIPNIEDNKIDATDLKFADFDDAEIRDYSLQKNDLLIIRSNGSVSLVGKCAQISDKDTEYLYAGYLIRLRPNPLIINAKYLTYILSSHFLRQQIESKAKSTSGVNNINSGEIQSLLIPIHSINEQIEISRLLDQKITNINSIELDIENSLNKAEALRQSILKKAFSGQLVPQDPNDEPASELLKRIQAEKADRETKTKRKSTK